MHCFYMTIFVFEKKVFQRSTTSILIAFQLLAVISFWRYLNPFLFYSGLRVYVESPLNDVVRKIVEFFCKLNFDTSYLLCFLIGFGVIASNESHFNNTIVYTIDIQILDSTEYKNDITKLRKFLAFLLDSFHHVLHCVFHPSSWHHAT